MGGEAPGKARVLHVITLLELGGAQENTLHTVRALDRGRYAVGLACGEGGMLDGEARGIAELDRFFVRSLVRPVRPHLDLRALRDLVAVMGRFRPHIVHTHSSKAGILGRLAARVAKVPIVIHSIHGFGFTPGQPAWLRAAFFWIERAIAPLTTHFIAVARANLTQGVRSGLFERGRATLIRSGIPLDGFRWEGGTDGAGKREQVRREVRAELGYAPETRLVGAVLCLKPQKDPLTFAETAARVLREEPGTGFCLAGDGELREALEGRLRDLGISGRVRLLGWRRDVPRLMGAFDVLLHTARWEGLPRVVPQAMAAGLPVVATAVDGIPEAVRHGESGFLVEPGDPRAMAGALLRLLREHGLGRRLGERGRELVEEFHVRELVPRQQALYERLLEAGRLGGPQGAARG